MTNRRARPQLEVSKRLRIRQGKLPLATKGTFGVAQRTRQRESRPFGKGRVADVRPGQRTNRAFMPASPPCTDSSHPYSRARERDLITTNSSYARTKSVPRYLKIRLLVLFASCIRSSQDTLACSQVKHKIDGQASSGLGLSELLGEALSGDFGWRAVRSGKRHRDHPVERRVELE